MHQGLTTIFTLLSPNSDTNTFGSGSNNIFVFVDSYQIEEVFQVFIENSIDSFHGKGRIEISAISLNEKFAKITNYF